MSQFRETAIQGVFVVDLFQATDARGSFVKTFYQPAFDALGLDSTFRESYFSVNDQGVIRGMHFQRPPHDHIKMVYCTRGALLDVVLDLRKSSATCGQSIGIELSENSAQAVYMPRGVAHGFCSLAQHTTMIYLTGTPHHPASDAGVRFDSFGFQWPAAAPIVSERDLALPTFAALENPF